MDDKDVIFCHHQTITNKTYLFFDTDLVSTYQIKFFMILAVLRRSLQRVCRSHLRVIAPGKHSGSFRRNVVAVASRLLHCVQFDRPEI